MPYVTHWEEETYDLVNGTLTICCEGMYHLAGLVTACKPNTKVIKLMNMEQIPWTPIVEIVYCPLCGKKIQFDLWT